MTNLDKLYYKCIYVLNTYTPHWGVLESALEDAGINPHEEAIPNDVNIIKIALGICGGFVATREQEGDISATTNWDAVKARIIGIANDNGLDPSLYIQMNLVEDATCMW